MRSMDNSETHFVNYDADELWALIQNTYVQCGGDILYPGDEKEILLRAVQAIGVAIMADCDEGIRQNTLMYAQDEKLDIKGDDRSCVRIEATAAKATVEIVFRANSVAQTIPAGTELTADGVVLYHLTEDIAQTGGEQTVTATIECSTAGTLGNGLPDGTQMQFIQTNDAIQSITTTSEASGGQDEETDDAYRERIHMKGLTSVTTGTEESYRSAAMAVSSVILDARPLAVSDLTVCVYLLLSDDTGSAAIISAVTDALNPKSTRPLTDHVSAALATKVSYSLDVQYGVPTGTSIESAVAAAVEEYSDWQDKHIGRPFDPDKLKSLLYQAGATRVVFGSSSTFDGGSTIEYTEIEDNEVCSGTITTAVMDI